jgi:hypothetical protein
MVVVDCDVPPEVVFTVVCVVVAGDGAIPRALSAAGARVFASELKLLPIDFEAASSAVESVPPVISDSSFT